MVINHYNRIIFKTVGLVGKYMDEIIREGMPKNYGHLDVIMGEKDVSAFIFQFFTDYHGNKIKKSAPSPEQAQKRMNEIRDYISQSHI